MWKVRNDFVHRREVGKKNSVRRKELLQQIEKELVRTSAHAEYSTKQLRHNARRSMGNALVPALEVWLQMLRNVKCEVFKKRNMKI